MILKTIIRSPIAKLIRSSRLLLPKSLPIASTTLFKLPTCQRFHTRSILLEDSTNLPPKGRLLISFTCKVCQHRNTKTMSKLAYEKGVVLIQCDGCENRHLIADNLGWFRDTKVNIEDIAKEKGEQVKHLNPEDEEIKGMLEYLPKDK